MSHGGISVKELKCFKNKTRLSKYYKRSKNKRERQRVRKNINCAAQYKRFPGYYW